MAIVTTDNKHYSDIADAIREKTGLATQYKPEEMPTGIGNVFEAGKQAEYDNFWDSYQANGTRASYNYGFREWQPSFFNPKYDIVPTTAIGTFYAMFNRETNGYSLKTALNNANVVLDTSKATSLSSLFGYSGVTEVPAIDTTSLPKLDRVFEASRQLKTIDKLVLRADGSQTFANVFINCNALQNLVIEGVIGNNDFSVQWSTKLTHDSLMSIMDALQDKSADTSGTTWKVTIGETNLAKLTAEEISAVKKKGWVIV